MRPVNVPIVIFDDDLAMRFEIVGAQEHFFTRGEENVSILEQATERDVGRVRKGRPVCPTLNIILGQKNLAVAESKGLVVAL